MKRILLATAISIGLCHMAAAQTPGSHPTNGPSDSTEATTRKGKKVQTTQVNERKVYHWQDGQRATPTGHEATGTGGNEAPLPKDSARADSDSTQNDR